MNYFELFQIDLTFDIDIEKLKSNYQRLQKLTHPDRFANAGDAQKRLYMQKNAQINDAYHVLTSPILRAEHILELRNFSLPDANASMGDTAFLMQQMELRDSMSEAKNADELNELRLAIISEQAEIENDISKLLSDFDAASDEKAALALTKLKFFTKLIVELEEKLLRL